MRAPGVGRIDPPGWMFSYRLEENKRLFVTPINTPRALFLQTLILLGVILFGFYVAGDRGLISLVLVNDRSFLSYLILSIYAAATIHWLWLSYWLGREGDVLGRREDWIERNGDDQDLSGLDASGARHASTLVHGYLDELTRHKGRAIDELALMLSTFEDEVVNRNALGHFVADGLLKLGLLGTIVGFILMLIPVAEISDFEAATMRQVLANMSGGMAVALYTTLTGLVTHLLLRLQYYMLDTATAKFVNRVGFVTNAYLYKPVSTSNPSSGSPPVASDAP